MTYIPAFSEIFVGLLVVLGATWWLQGRPRTRRAASIVFWVCGVAVVLGQGLAIATLASYYGSTDIPEIAVFAVGLGRWGSFLTVVGGLLTCGGLTAWTLSAGPGEEPTSP